MTRKERARQIDAEEFRRESEQALARALAYSKQKQEAYRRFVLGLEQIDEPPTLSPKRNRERSKRNTFQRKRVKVFTIDGITMTTPEWAERVGVSYQTLWERAKRFGSMEAAVKQPPRRGPKKIEFSGRSLTRKQWAVYFGISYDNLCQRIHKHGLTAALERCWSRRHPGVGKDSAIITGTGAGAVAQETPNIAFSEDA